MTAVDWVARQPGDKIRGNADRVHHAAPGVPGVRVETLEGDGNRVGRKALELQFPAPAAVERVGAHRPETFHVEVVRAAADLFVGRERDAHRTMWNLGVCHQLLGRRHNLRDPRLVVRAEQRKP